MLYAEHFVVPYGEFICNIKILLSGLVALSPIDVCPVPMKFQYYT